MAVASLIAAGGTLAALALKNQMDKKRYERELKDQQIAWQRNNQYNSPVAQMARLKAAGLSPNLIYQNGGATVTSDTQGVPSYPDAPMADFNSAAQMYQQSSILNAQIAKTNAETETISSENKDRFSPLSKLYNLNQQEQDYYAQMYGVDPNQVSLMSANKIEILSALKRASSENENIRELYNVIVNEANQAESNAIIASLNELLVRMEADTMSKKTGHRVELGSQEWIKGHGRYIPDTRTAYSLFESGHNLEFEMFLRQLKEIHWQSSDGKHILDQVHQFMHDIPVVGSLRRGKPTIRGIERYGYDNKRGDWDYYERYDYGK